MDTAAVVADLLPSLVADSVDNLVWWTEDELYRHINQTANELAKRCVLLVYKADIGIVATDATYAFPDDYLNVMEIALDGTIAHQTSSAQMLALDPSWKTATGAPDRYCLDSEAPGLFRLYPEPIGDGAAVAIYRARPVTATSGSPTLDLPAPMSELLWWGTLTRARAKEGKASMPDVAAMASQVASLLETAATDIWSAD